MRMSFYFRKNHCPKYRPAGLLKQFNAKAVYQLVTLFQKQETC